MSNSLSETMAAALADIGVHGGTIHRFIGGYWVFPTSPRDPRDGHLLEYHSDSTIQALVDRGELEY